MSSVPTGFFPPEPLDLRDRLILEAICRHGKKGQSFNRLVDEMKPFVSRSTLAVRLERLQRLNYVEKLADDKMKQVRWIRGSLPARMLMWHIARAKEQVKAIEECIAKKDENVLKTLERGTLPAEIIDDLRRFVQDIQRRVSIIFSMVAEIAITYGEAPASYIFLPAIIEDLRNMTLRFSSLIQKRPELTVSIALGAEGKPPEERVKDVRAFFEEFGEELFERAPIPLESRKAMLAEILKNPERLATFISALQTPK